MALRGRLEHRRPAGEDDVGALEHLGLERLEQRRSIREGGEFVHLVEDDEVGFEVARERQCHRGVEPQGDPTRGGGNEVIEHGALVVDRCGGRGPVRQRRLDDADTVVAMEDDHTRRRIVVEDRLLDDDNIVGAGGTGQEMLRALENKVPAQMRKRDQRGPCDVVHCEDHRAPGHWRQR